MCPCPWNASKGRLVTTKYRTRRHVFVSVSVCICLWLIIKSADIMFHFQNKGGREEDDFLKCQLRRLVASGVFFDLRKSAILHFWLTPNPLYYYTSDLLARSFTAAIWTCGLSARSPIRPSRSARPPKIKKKITIFLFTLINTNEHIFCKYTKKMFNQTKI